VAGGRFAIRPCQINARTAPEQVNAVVADVVRIGDEPAAAHSPPIRPPAAYRGLQRLLDSQRLRMLTEGAPDSGRLIRVSTDAALLP
jgi:hypothetical protein